MGWPLPETRCCTRRRRAAQCGHQARVRSANSVARMLGFVLSDGANGHSRVRSARQRASSASFCPTVPTRIPRVRSASNAHPPLRSAPTVPTRILGFVFCQTTRILRFVLPDGANAHPSGSFCHTGPMRILGFVLPNAGGRGIARRADSRGLGRVRNETPTPHPNAPCWDSQARPTWRFSRTRVNALAPRADTMRKRRTRQAKKARRDFRPGFLCSSVRWAF